MCVWVLGDSAIVCLGFAGSRMSRKRKVAVKEALFQRVPDAHSNERAQQKSQIQSLPEPLPQRHLITVARQPAPHAKRQHISDTQIGQSKRTHFSGISAS